MKIAVCSDLHLEFGPITLENTEGAEVLILSGDICVPADIRTADPYGIVDTSRSTRIFDFFNSCSSNFKHVLYVSGNHEHYHYDYKHTLTDLKGHLSHYPNITVLDKEAIDIDGIRFVGGTLWTNFNEGDEHTLQSIGRMMNDFRIVKNSNRVIHYKDMTYKKKPDGMYERDANGDLIVEKVEFKERTATFSPEDAYEDHKQMISFLQNTLSATPEDMKVVVVGHHAPSKKSTHPRYKHETIMNGGYSSDLEQIMLDNPKIKLWTHGHTHEVFDYMIGETRIVCNPRGYINHERRADDFELKFVEV